VKNKYPNGERRKHQCSRCGRSFRTPFRAAGVCPSCERAIEAGETLLIQHPAGTGRRASTNAKRVKRVVSGGLPELGKKR
jgi:hypothetical protein